MSLSHVVKSCEQANLSLISNSGHNFVVCKTVAGLFTCVLFFGPFSFQFLMQMYFFVSFSTKLEKNEAFQAPGDYLFFLITTILLLDIFSAVLQWPTGMPLLGPSLVFVILFVFY